MKRAAAILGIPSLGILSLGILSLGILTIAFSAAAQATAQAAQPAAQAAPAAKRPPQAKTQPEFDAYKVAAASPDGASMEKAADDFATKFPTSELRVLLYKNTMRAYQKADNAEKTESEGRKVLSCDPDDPEALVVVAGAIAERTHDTDIDRDQRFGEATAMAKKALTTIDTAFIPAGTPQAQVDAYKSGLRSQAYSIMGAIDYKKEDYVTAQDDLQKSIDAYPSDPAPVDILRMALAIDKQATAASDDRAKQQKLYADALKVANRAVELTQDNTAIGTPARRERERLQQLVEGAAPAQPQSPPKN